MNPISLINREGDMTQLSEKIIEGFRQRLRGSLLTESDDGFEKATKLWNGMINKTPNLVVQPTGTADVVEAINFVRENNLLFSIRGGGHNIAGTALVDKGFTIDMSQLKGVLVNPKAKTVTVQAGCLLGDVDRETQLYGLATPLGFVSETGLSGVDLGRRIRLSYP
jgi:FAD/FMN-containing dehydrogenase